MRTGLFRSDPNNNCTRACDLNPRRLPMLRKYMVQIALGVATMGSLIGQSITSGDITGTVTAPSDAALTGVTVTLQARGTGLTLSTTANAEGFYRFALLAPGSYAVSVSPAGFQKTERVVEVQVGQA